MKKNFLTILDITKEINRLLDIVEQDECDCCEGSLSMHLETIKNLLSQIDKQWFLYMHIWGEDYV